MNTMLSMAWLLFVSIRVDVQSELWHDWVDGGLLEHRKRATLNISHCLPPGLPIGFCRLYWAQRGLGGVNEQKSCLCSKSVIRGAPFCNSTIHSNMPAQQGCLLNICLMCYWDTAHTSVQGKKEKAAEECHSHHYLCAPYLGMGLGFFIHKQLSVTDRLSLRESKNCPLLPRDMLLKLKWRLG